MKTLLQLQEVMGAQIDEVLKDGLTPEERQTANERAHMVMCMGKQMINNADMMLRYEKLQAQNANLTHSKLKSVIGY